MRITDLDIDGFGVWSRLELRDLADGVTVFYGANEAGKTTLMQFVRSVMFGFSPERRARYLPPVAGGRPGGALHTLAGHRPLVLSRTPDAAHEAGQLTITDATGSEMPDDGTLATMLGDVDEIIFNNVFAFGLHEIQELSTLTDTQAAEQLYSLALGMDRASLVDVLSELTTSRNRLLAPDERPSLVAQLLSQRQRLQAELAELGEATPRYLALLSERQSLDGELARLQAENAQLESDGRQLALARALLDRWQRRGALDTKLQSLVGCEGMEPGALASFDRLQARRETLRRRYRRLRRDRRKQQQQIDALKINDALCRNAQRIEALAEQQPWLEAIETQITQLTAEINELESRRGNDSARGAPPLTKSAVAELRAAARSWRDSRRALHEINEKIAQRRQQAGNQQNQIQSALGSQKQQGLTAAVAEAGQLVTQLRHRVQLDGRLDQMRRRAGDLEQEGQQHLENQLLPTWLLASLGGLFVLGCALLLLFLVGLVLPASLGTSLSWPLAVFGLLAFGGAALGKFGLERAAVFRLESCQDQAQQLRQQIEEAEAERKELDESLPRGGGPLVSRLQAAEKNLARLEELLPLAAKEEESQRQTDADQKQQATLAAQVTQGRQAWKRLLATHRLPSDLMPGKLGVYVQRSRQSQKASAALADLQQQRDRRRTEAAALGSRIHQLLSEVRVAPRGDRPLDHLRACLVELGEQKNLLQQRDTLDRQIALIRRRQKKLQRTARKLHRRAFRLLRSSGAHDEPEFRRRAKLQAESFDLRAQRAQLSQEIAAALGNQLSEEQLASYCAAPQQLIEREEQLAAARDSARARLTAAIERRGEMNQQLRTLVDNRQLPQMRIELGIVERRLQDALDRWRVLAVCGVLLEAVRQFYEREHQPLALQEASGYLERLTGGRYPRVWTPLGAHALVIDDDQGRHLNVEVLSRGTREQLFLALRLALVSSYAKRGIQLPLVLDDILVNFDVGRAKAAATVLRDFARRGQQILLFTCHEHIARVFKNLKVDVRTLPENSRAKNIASDEPAPRPARRVRQPLPEPEPIPEPVVEEVAEEPVIEEIELPPAPIAIAPVPVAPPPVVPAPVIPAPVIVEPPPSPTPPPPKPAPIARKPAVRRRTERVQWSAEEFDGELADRVRRTELIDDSLASDASDSDAEAA